MLRTLGQLVERQRCITASVCDTVLDTVKVMAENRIGALPVLNEGRLVGVFSERDVLTRVLAIGLDPRTTRLGQVVTLAVETASAGDGVVDALERMRQRGCRHLPVLQNGELLGMLSLRDVTGVLLEEVRRLHELFEYLPIEPGPGG
ncbi:MAG: CBS domain-containing protein [Planctomycetes bacterium]|nr:CBS domain-containing protein [Planctomycetota bacterium]